MATKFSKLRSNLELKQENAWLRNAFKRAYSAAEEQSDNAAELTRALWAAAQQNGGELRIPESAMVLANMPANAKLRSRRDEATGEIVFISHVADEQPEVPNGDETGVQEAAEKIDQQGALETVSDR